METFVEAELKYRQARIKEDFQAINRRRQRRARASRARQGYREIEN